MRAAIKVSTLVLLAIFSTGESIHAQSANLAALQRSFEHPPGDARVMMRWWWFGPSVAKSELEREMRVMKDSGIGGFEVQPVYPLTLDDPERGLRNFSYLSPEFLDALRFTGEKAREMKLRMDLTLGSGWPFGGPHIPMNKAAGRLRVERVPLPVNGANVPSPRLDEGEELIARTESGLEQNRVILFFISSHTKQAVKRAAMGSEGLVLDHYNRAALDTHLKTVGEPMLKALEKTPPHAIFSDSLEVYDSDWTPDFLSEFSKRRGYDLKPYLPALAGDIGESTAAIRHDWAQTLTELLDQQYLTPLADWAHQHKTLLRSQTYGLPPASLSSNALVDLPEGEGSDWRQFSMTRWASSASHLYGRPVTSSETWTWLHSPAFRATPLDMKAEADRHFLEGINQLIGHGWPYTPPGIAEPGWSFYAAAAFGEHNPWWIVMPDVASYLQRVSFLLRQGRPANDIAVYLPTDDAWATFTLGHASLNQTLDKMLGKSLFPGILDAGYNFDFIDDAAIARMGVNHPVLILPGVERIPLSSYQTIAEYARHGGKVLALRRAPSLAPGFRDAGSSPRVREISQGLFGTSSNQNVQLVIEESQLAAALHRFAAPDAILPPQVGFVHRKTDFADIYFLANTGNRPVSGRAEFRVTGRASQWWDPFSGRVTRAGDEKIELVLAPYESRILVFTNAPQTSPGVDVKMPAAGPLDISSGWMLTFPGQSPAITLDRLRSWTDEPERKYFSGSANYEKTINIDAALLADKREKYLNFGEGTPIDLVERRAGSGMRAMMESPVHEAALVYVNGQLAGSVWRPPYEIAIGGLLREGTNSLRVVVANLAINEMARGPRPDYRELTAKFGERFQAQDMNNLQPLPSGLLGPIRLLSH